MVCVTPSAATHFIQKFKKKIFVHLFVCLELNVEDAETEVALNLICVDDTTRKPIDIPIRPRPVKDLLNDSQRKQNAPNETESRHKERKDATTKAGNSFK